MFTCHYGFIKRRRRNKKIWVKKWLAARDDKGAYNNIIQELRLDDVESYRRYLRMNTETFEELLLNISPKLEKQRTMMRKPLSVAEKLACTVHPRLSEHPGIKFSTRCSDIESSDNRK